MMVGFGGDLVTTQDRAKGVQAFQGEKSVRVSYSSSHKKKIQEPLARL